MPEPHDPRVLVAEGGELRALLGPSGHLLAKAAERPLNGLGLAGRDLARRHSDRRLVSLIRQVDLGEVLGVGAVLKRPPARDAVEPTAEQPEFVFIRLVAQVRNRSVVDPSEAGGHAVAQRVGDRFCQRDVQPVPAAHQDQGLEEALGDVVVEEVVGPSEHARGTRGADRLGHASGLDDVGQRDVPGLVGPYPALDLAALGHDRAHRVAVDHGAVDLLGLDAFDVGR